MNKHKARATTASHLYFLHCSNSCYGHGNIHPEYSVSHDRRVSLSDKAIHIGGKVKNNPSILQKLPPQYHKYMGVFDPEKSETLPDIRGCDHRIELLGSQGKL